MSLAIAVRIAGSSVRSIAGHAWRAAVRRCGSRRPRPSRRSPSRRCRAPAACPPRSKLARSAAAACDQRVAVLGRASARAARRPPAPSSAPSGARPRRPARARSRCSARNGYRKLDAPASWMRRAVAALEQTAVLEEHVHELPQHVVERLDQLLADVAGLGRRLELPLGAGRRERDRQASRARARASARAASPPILVGPERDRDVVWRARCSVDLGDELAALARRARSPAARACRRSPGGRTRRPRGGRPSAPPASGRSAISRPPRAKRSAIRWHSRASRSASAAKNSPVRFRCAAQQRFEAPGRVGGERRVAHASASSRAATASSHSRQAVDALAGARAEHDPLDVGVDLVDVVEQPVEVEVQVRRAGRSC